MREPNLQRLQGTQARSSTSPIAAGPGWWVCRVMLTGASSRSEAANATLRLHDRLHGRPRGPAPRCVGRSAIAGVEHSSLRVAVATQARKGRREVAGAPARRLTRRYWASARSAVQGNSAVADGARDEAAKHAQRWGSAAEGLGSCGGGRAMGAGRRIGGWRRGQAAARARHSEWSMGGAAGSGSRNTQGKSSEGRDRPFSGHGGSGWRRG
jgi:hypothetical protein